MTAPAIRDYLRAAAADAAGPADADLLARFAAARDETAFELLVWRHAALVQRVCRAVLRDRHAAEDAAQAAFLVLARKAGTFAGRGAVAGWVYRVARRAAVRLAKQRARLPGPLPHPDRLPAAEPPDPAAADEQAALLWAEIDRLPERYRLPVLLCHFEGLTHPEAARRLGWPVGTVAGRLSRARAQLGRRLAGRGVGLGAVAVGLPSGGFVSATARAAVAFADRGAVAVSPGVVTLAEGVTRTMTAYPFKLAAAAVVMATGLSAGLWAGGPGTGPVPAADEPAAPAPAARAEKPAAKPADAATRAKVANSLKQILLAIHNYHDVNGRFPADITDKDGKPLLSWRVSLLPYLEQGNLYRSFKLDEPWDSGTNQKVAFLMPAVYRLPGQPKGEAKTYFQGLSGPGTMFERGKKLTMASVTDGLSNTLAVLAAGEPVDWAKPADLPFDPEAPKVPASPYPNVLVVGLGDGSVYPIGPKLDPDLFRRLAVRDDGEVIDDADIPRPDPRATAKEDRATADDLRRDIVALREQAEALAAEREKLLADRKAARAADIDALLAEQRELTNLVERLRAEIEQLRKGEDPKPTPRPAKTKK